MFLTKNKPLLVISILLGIAYLMAGLAKIFSAGPMVEAFTRYGYPLAFMYFIGVCEIAGAAGLFVRQTALFAAIGLAIIMLGAVGSHWLHDPFAQSIPALVLLALLCAAIYLHIKSRKPGEAPGETTPGSEPSGSSQS